MNELALFAGAGGSILAGHLLGWRTVCAVEIDAYCRRVLMQRQDDGILDPFPIWDDVRTFDGVAWRGRVDVITAGFPCQPFSQAGRRKGADDERNMWPETIRIIRGVRPRFCLLENVPGLLSGKKQRIRWHTVERSLFGRIRASHHATISLPPYFATVLGDLAACGYDARWRVLSAAELGAPHKRDRLWIYCYADKKSKSTMFVNDEASRLSEDVSNAEFCGREPRSGWEEPARERWPESTARSEAMAHAHIPRLEVGQRIVRDDGEKLQAAADRDEMRRPAPREGRHLGQPDGGSGGHAAIQHWPIEPAMGRVVNGVANRVDQLRALGNGWVPRVGAGAWRLLKEDL